MNVRVGDLSLAVSSVALDRFYGHKQLCQFKKVRRADRMLVGLPDELMPTIRESHDADRRAEFNERREDLQRVAVTAHLERE